MKTYFVTGIGTEVGKTVSSAIIAGKLKADYWKPIQAGTREQTDSQRVRSLLPDSTMVHPESYCLKEPMSPHAAAERENIEISCTRIIRDFIHIRESIGDKTLVIEGAGGIMVPLNSKDLFIDLVEKLQAEVIIVSKNYLGSINHTLLTIELLSRRCINVAGILFNGDENKDTENFILQHSKLSCLGNLPLSENIDQTFIENMKDRITL